MRSAARSIFCALLQAGAPRRSVRDSETPKKLVKAQSISDSVALSTEPTMADLSDMLQTLTRLAIDLLCEGFFVRGAIVKGPLYDDDHMVFERPSRKPYWW
jgi:hypothetical protein